MDTKFLKYNGYIKGLLSLYLKHFDIRVFNEDI